MKYIKHINELILSEVFIKQLKNIPETGMGYHKVNVELNNGKIINDVIVLNCSKLKLNIPYNITNNDIKNITI